MFNQDNILPIGPGFLHTSCPELQNWCLLFTDWSTYFRIWYSLLESVRWYLWIVECRLLKMFSRCSRLWVTLEHLVGRLYTRRLFVRRQSEIKWRIIRKRLSEWEQSESSSRVEILVWADDYPHYLSKVLQRNSGPITGIDIR